MKCAICENAPNIPDMFICAECESRYAVQFVCETCNDMKEELEMANEYECLECAKRAASWPLVASYSVAVLLLLVLFLGVIQ
jgi:hypothetical protein